MSIIQQAIDNKPLIQQIVTNLLAGKSSEDIFDSTGYLSSNVNLPAKDFIQHLLFVWFNHNGRYDECGIKQLLADRLSNLNPIQSILGDLHERL